MSDLKAWQISAAANNDPSPDGWPENMNRTGVNDSARECMAAIARWYRAPHWHDLYDDYTVTKNSAQVVKIAGVDATDILVADLRIRVSGGGTVAGFIDSVVYSAPDTLVTVTLDGGGAVPAGTNVFEVASFLGGRAATRNVLDAGGGLTPTSKLVSIDGFDDAVNGSIATGDMGSAALADTGSNGNEVPLNSSLGTAAAKDVGVVAGDLVLKENLAGVVQSDLGLGELAYDNRPFKIDRLIATENSNSVSLGEWEPTDWPAGMAIAAADGATLLCFRLQLVFDCSSGGSDKIDEVSAHIGPTGDKTDPQIGVDATGTSLGSFEYLYQIGPVFVLPALNDMLTIRILNLGGSSTRIIKISKTGDTLVYSSFLRLVETIGEE